ncbi:hypothetical protein [Rahnella inusitata]|uniref:hypothetical protein n=1 Tax=Rahnella inusitata TaxID=58169 RepID=UPI001BC838E5|nr:hypothetical protein [Rahnella inusitata]QUT14571.1 hypothetical protein I2123_18170 [Rahnella inusitata]
MNKKILITNKEIEDSLSTRFNVDEFLRETFKDMDTEEFSDSEELAAVDAEQILSKDREYTDIEKRIYASAKDLCNEFSISEEIYLPVLILFVLAVAKRREHEARTHLSTFFSSLIHANLLSKAPVLIGGMGGRPEHTRKPEALEIAKNEWENYPTKSQDNVTNFIYAKLSEKYTDAPSISAIKGWLRTSGLRPGSKKK